jgi:hypothetical protein
MTHASNDADPTVPIGSAIVEDLKVAGPQSASALARRLQLRKADVLVACRALAAASQIRRLGKRWAVRLPVRCAGLNKAGRQCARAAASGGAFCALHEPDTRTPLPRPKPLAAEASIAEPAAPTESVMRPRSPPREEEPALPEASNVAPELFVGGHRVTEADVIEALSMLGDEELQAYRDGRLPKAKAYRIARNRVRTIARMRIG